MMAVNLEGKCTVRELREGTPTIFGSLSIWRHAGKEFGAAAISLRVMEFSPGVSPGLLNEGADEVIYFAENPNDKVPDHEPVTAYVDGRPYHLTPQTGVYLRPGQILTIENKRFEPIILVSSQCPDPGPAEKFLAPLKEPKPGFSEPRSPLVRLGDRQPIPTGDRWYRVLVDDDVGSTQVTQFVGSIPPGRAPDHFHHYEEVLFILKGQGRMWAAETHTPISPGSCIFLPRGQMHCVENTGSGELRLLGVFYPAGSPAVRYSN
jgi:mannose-6-phosphate isomerase-like protein (cupin superfamily)